MSENSKKMGRPRIEIDWDEFDKLCAIQCTLNEIASWFDCSIDTIENRVKEVHGITFSEYFDQKRGKGKASLRRLQFQLAESGNPTMLIWLGKQWLDQSDKQEIDHKSEDGKGLNITLNYARKGKE
jgi:hypothetical protein